MKGVFSLSYRNQKEYWMKITRLGSTSTDRKGEAELLGEPQHSRHRKASGQGWKTGGSGEPGVLGQAGSAEKTKPHTSRPSAHLVSACRWLWTRLPAHDGMDATAVVRAPNRRWADPSQARPPLCRGADSYSITSSDPPLKAHVKRIRPRELRWSWWVVLWLEHRPLH